MATSESNAQALERLHEERVLLSQRLRRRSEAMQFLQLMTKTFVSLSLNDQREISDTLSSLIATFLEARFGAVMLRADDGSFFVAACQGTNLEALTTAGAFSAFGLLIEERIAQHVHPARAEALWPDRPAPMRDGFVCCAIETHDVARGLILVADKSSGDAVSEEELEFIAAAAGLGGMALRNAELMLAQTSLTRDVELQVEQARFESEAKQHALDEVDRKLQIIEQQKSSIRQLSSPVLQLWQDVLAMPMIGTIDSAQAEEITERLLTEVAAQRARFVIIDLTAVEVVDTHMADSLLRLMKAVSMLGASCVVTGIRSAVAQSLVAAGADLSAVTTRRNLRAGLAECLQRLHSLQPMSDGKR